MRVLSSAALIITLAAAAACGGATTPSSPTPVLDVPSVRMALSGSVHDAQDNAGIAGTGVSVISGPDTGRSTSTDAAGNFTLRDLKVGVFSVRFTRDGFMIEDRTVNATEDARMDVQLKRGPTCVRPVPPANFRVSVSGTTASFNWDYVANAIDYVITLRMPDGRAQTGNATVSPHTWRRLPRGQYLANMATHDSCGQGNPTADVTFTVR